MTKEDYLIRFLDKLVNFFPELRRLQIQVNNNQLDGDMFKVLSNELGVTTNTVLNDKQRRILNKSLEFMSLLEKLKVEDEQIDELEKILNNI